MGIVMWVAFKNFMFALFMLMSPLMLLGSHYQNKRSGRRTRRGRLAEHAKMLERAIATLDAMREEEIASRARESPSVGETAEFVHDLSPRLWNATPTRTSLDGAGRAGGAGLSHSGGA